MLEARRDPAVPMGLRLSELILFRSLLNEEPLDYLDYLHAIRDRRTVHDASAAASNVIIRQVYYKGGGTEANLAI